MLEKPAIAVIGGRKVDKALPKEAEYAGGEVSIFTFSLSFFLLICSIIFSV